MVLKIARDSSKTSEGVKVSLPVTIPKGKDSTEDRGFMDSILELKKTVINK